MDAGKPLHITEIISSIGKLRNQEMKRTSVESSLISHMNNAKDKARIVRTDRATYGLPAWLRPSDATPDETTPSPGS